MITEEQYKEALNIVNQYRKQLSLSENIDVYEWLKTEMMTTTEITLEEFEEVLQMYLRKQRKKC